VGDLRRSQVRPKAGNNHRQLNTPCKNAPYGRPLPSKIPDNNQGGSGTNCIKRSYQRENYPNRRQYAAYQQWMNPSEKGGEPLNVK
jgi:hypothetical protein